MACAPGWSTLQHDDIACDTLVLSEPRHPFFMRREQTERCQKATCVQDGASKGALSVDEELSADT